MEDIRCEEYKRKIMSLLNGTDEIKDESREGEKVAFLSSDEIPLIISVYKPMGWIKRMAIKLFFGFDYHRVDSDTKAHGKNKIKTRDVTFIKITPAIGKAMKWKRRQYNHKKGIYEIVDVYSDREAIIDSYDIVGEIENAEMYEYEEWSKDKFGVVSLFNV